MTLYVMIYTMLTSLHDIVHVECARRWLHQCVCFSRAEITYVSGERVYSGTLYCGLLGPGEVPCIERNPSIVDTFGDLVKYTVEPYIVGYWDLVKCPV